MPTKPSLDAILDLSKADMDKVNALILDNMQSDVTVIPELAGYLIAAGGKRIRPMLTCMTARMCGVHTKTKTETALHQIPLYATCIEFIHTATLLHDDVIDESHMRRGQQSAHKIWGNKATVLVGDFLFARAFDLMANANNPAATQVLSHASRHLAEGEMLQLLNTQNMDTTIDMYLHTIKAKTAVLFAAAAKVGGVISNQSAAICDTLYTYGESLGTAFQMIDDALDYSANDATIGKNSGDDFKEGKITLPVLTVMEKCTADETHFLTRTIGNRQQTDGDFAKMCTLIEKYDAIAHTLDMAKTYGDKAKQNLHALPFNNTYTAALADMIDYAIYRTH